MPESLANAVMVTLKSSIVIVVVGWILNVPGRLGIALFTEQMLAVVLGCSLALTFLMFPPRRPATGEDAEGGSRQEAHPQVTAIGWG